MPFLSHRIASSATERRRPRAVSDETRAWSRPCFGSLRPPGEGWGRGGEDLACFMTSSPSQWHAVSICWSVRSQSISQLIYLALWRAGKRLLVAPDSAGVCVYTAGAGQLVSKSLKNWNRAFTIISASLSISIASVALYLLTCHLSHLSVCVSVGRFVCLSVCLSGVYCGKMAEWIRMPFGMVSGVDWGMGALDGGPGPPEPVQWGWG